MSEAFLSRMQASTCADAVNPGALSRPRAKGVPAASVIVNFTRGEIPRSLLAKTTGDSVSPLRSLSQRGGREASLPERFSASRATPMQVRYAGATLQRWKFQEKRRFSPPSFSKHSVQDARFLEPRSCSYGRPSSFYLFFFNFLLPSENE